MKNQMRLGVQLATLFVLLLLAVQCSQPLPPKYTAPVSPLSTPLAYAPANINQLLSHASLIVIAEVGEVDKYIDFAIYGDDGELVDTRPLSPFGGPMGNIDATDFVLNIIEVLRDDGTVAAGGEAVILRSIGHLTAEGTKKLRSIDTSGFTYTFPWTGDRGLYLLHPTPDGKAYTFYFDGYSWLHIDGESLRLSDGVRSPLILDGEEVSLSALRWSLQHPDAAFSPDYSRYTTLDELLSLDNFPVTDIDPPIVPEPTLTSAPTETPSPTIDPVTYHAVLWGVSRRAAEARLAWLVEGGEETIAETQALTERLRQEEPTFLVAWHEMDPEFRYIVRLDQVDPDEATFREKYLQEYAWSESVTLLGRDQDDPMRPFTPSPDFTPTPVVDPVDFYQQRYGFTREGAIAKAKWAAMRSEVWKAEADELVVRLRDTHPTYLVSWVDDTYFFTYYIRFDEEEPDADAFAEQYLQGYEWADRVVVLGVDE